MSYFVVEREVDADADRAYVSEGAKTDMILKLQTIGRAKSCDSL
jgi:hypothetical protein